MRPQVTLRAVEPEDVDFMLECESDSDISFWTDYQAPLSRHQLMEYALNYDADPFSAGQLRLIIETSENNGKKEKTGILDLYGISVKDSRAFVGICIHPAHRNGGIGTSSLETLKEYNRLKLGLDQFTAKIASDNSAALRLFEKSGFRKIATLPKWHRVGNRFYDFFLLSFMTGE